MDVSACAEALDVLAPEILRLCGTPGMSIAVGVGDRVALTRAYGYADVTARRPMTTDTVGPTGSDAKTYTAAAIMQLVEAGLIRLDDPVNDHLTGWKVINPLGDREITLRDLLTHRSGMGPTLGYCGLEPPQSLNEHLRRIFADGRSDLYGGAVMPLWTSPVGKRYQYSNTGIALVGLLIETLNADRVSFSEWMQRRLFTPLAMDSTCFPPAHHTDCAPGDLLKRRSTGYATLDGYRFELPPVHIGDYPAGSALSTPSDHVRFVLMMLNGGALDGRGVLTPETTRCMLTPQGDGAVPGEDPAVGLTWNIFKHGDPLGYVGHGGEYYWGWNQFTRGWPGPRIALVVSTNQWDLADQGSSGRPSHLAARLVADVVSTWVSGRDPRSQRDPAAARSYLAGVLIADRYSGRLGIARPLADSEIVRIADTVAVEPGTPWDREAFCEAMRAHCAAGGTPRDMLMLLRRQLTEEHSALLQRQLGVPYLGQTLEPFLRPRS
ncbi:serine hydrolase domain-containing protein [Streptomyces sioyaensis]|uniref:serine hydrolase domain-containing protein n=1 Tax=Streptomyces sioyaensis TaxID=67364 RepID=UPI0033E341C5